MLALQAPVLPQIGHYNLGWLALARAAQDLSPEQKWAAKAIQQFTDVDASARHTSLGIGLAEMLRARPQAAISAWSTGHVDAARLISLGPVYEARDRPSQALTLYRGADAILQQPDNTGIVRAGALCRRTRFDLSQLDAIGQSVCGDLFATNTWMILNRQFVNPDIEGWTTYGLIDPLTVSYHLDAADGHPPPSLTIRRTNLPLGKENGIYQRVPMQPGERVRFSAWFRAEGDQAFDSRLLYIQWIHEGRSAGNHGAKLSEPTDWVYFEREFELRSEAPQVVSFFPALLTGSATLWVDDVQLELLPE